MSLPDDLLTQAQELAMLDRQGRPKQANLRRAVSASYYALFHKLVEEGSRLMLPPNPSRSDLARIGRSFDHKPLKRISQAFASFIPNKDPDRNTDSRSQKDSLKRIVELIKPSPKIRLVASTFVRLQEARHEADYDISINYTRNSALSAVSSARSAFDAWNESKRDPDQSWRSFLIALLSIDKNWDRL